MATWRIHVRNPSVTGCNSTRSNHCGAVHTLAFVEGASELMFRRTVGEDWWLETDSFDPVLPAKVTGTVTKVTFLGAPPTDDITPGLYEMEFNPSGGLITAAVASVTENGDRLKVELSASSIDEARMLWRKVLKNDDSIRTVPYRRKATAA